MAFYTDECTPGNNLRCDGGRALQCLYWCLMDFPDYVRSRDNGWYCFGVLQTKFVEKIPGGLSALVSRMQEVFFGSTFNFGVTGMNFRGTDGKGDFHLFLSSGRLYFSTFFLFGGLCPPVPLIVGLPNPIFYIIFLI